MVATRALCSPTESCIFWHDTPCRLILPGAVNSLSKHGQHTCKAVEWMRPSTCELHSLEPQVAESCSIKIAAHCTWPTMLRVRLTNELCPLQLRVQEDHPDLQPQIVGQAHHVVQQLWLPLTELYIGATRKWSNENHFIINRHSRICIENCN